MSRLSQKMEELFPYLGTDRSFDNLKMIEPVGNGSFGTSVYRAKDLKKGDFLAVKKLRFNENNTKMYAREIEILRFCDHENIVKYVDVVRSQRDRETLYLLMELCDQDLYNLMEISSNPIPVSQIKCVMLQIFQGLHHIHEQCIIHRDLTSANVLLNNDGIVKLADFGSARKFNPIEHEMMTPRNVTSLWYRSLEMLLEYDTHSPGVDIWAVAIIFLELLGYGALIRGKSEIHQLLLVLDLLGTPTEEMWPDLRKCRNMTYIDFRETAKDKLDEKIPTLTQCGLEFLRGAFAFNPKSRFTAKNCLDHNYFQEEPIACKRSALSKTIGDLKKGAGTK